MQEWHSTQHQDMSTILSSSVIYAPSKIVQDQSGQPPLLKKAPVRMIIEIVAASAFWFHALPHHNGISTTMNPHEIITGMILDYNHHCKHEYGDYVQTHEQHDNPMSLQTIGDTAMRPSGNEQSGHYYISLNTSRRLNHNNVTPLPMPSEVIDHVHIIAHRAPIGLTFADINNVAFPDILDDEKVVDVSNSDSDDSGNYDDPSEAADPEDSVDITGVDDQEYKLAVVTTQ